MEISKESRLPEMRRSLTPCTHFNCPIIFWKHISPSGEFEAEDVLKMRRKRESSEKLSSVQ